VHLIFDKRLVAFSPISLIGSLSMTLTLRIFSHQSVMVIGR